MKSKMIDTVFFDWGGVIAGDSADDFLSNLLKELGASDEQADEIYNSYMRDFMKGNISEVQYWDTLRERYGLTIHDTISDEFKNWRGLDVNNDILALVDDVKARGLQVALFTNVIEPTYNVLNEAGHYDRFPTVIASWQTGFCKPQPEIYQLALRQVGTTAERSLFIDDKQRNLDPAAALGFQTILAENPAQIIADTMAYL